MQHIPTELLSIDMLSNTVATILVLFFFYFLNRFVKKFITKLFSGKAAKLKNHMLIFVTQSMRVIIWIVAIISILSIWGFDVSSLVASLGLTGFALGFAMKDIISSSIAGVMIIFYHPFKLRSKISVVGITGIVTNIDMRYITLENDEGRHLIPNSKLISEKVTIHNSCIKF